jgi:hypothetical protein
MRVWHGIGEEAPATDCFFNSKENGRDGSIDTACAVWWAGLGERTGHFVNRSHHAGAGQRRKEGIVQRHQECLVVLRYE